MLSKESSDIPPSWIPVEELGKNEWIFCYPSMDKTCIKETKKELMLLGVKKVRFSGKSVVKGCSVLGKGKNSIVIEGLMNDETVACKILRSDASRKDMKWEENMLRRANSVSVGPKILGAGNRVLVMERLYGCNLDEFLRKAGKEEIKMMVSKLLDQARALDKAKIRHKELANASKHVIVDIVKPTIIDFESVSLNCKGHNVAAICQYIFIRRMGNLLRLSKNSLIELLRNYRKKPTEKNFLHLKKIIIANI
jgi:predicted Ser/Thr protein kinase